MTQWLVFIPGALRDRVFAFAAYGNGYAWRVRPVTVEPWAWEQPSVFLTGFSA